MDQHDMEFHGVKLGMNFELTKDTQYLTFKLTGKLWGVCYKYFRKILACYSEIQWYIFF